MIDLTSGLNMLRILDPFATQYTSTVPDMIDTIIAALSCSLITVYEECHNVQKIVWMAMLFSDKYTFAISIHADTRLLILSLDYVRIIRCHGYYDFKIEITVPNHFSREVQRTYVCFSQSSIFVNMAILIGTG